MTTLSCLAIFAFAIVGLSLLFYFLYRNKFGAAAVTAACLLLGTCAVVVRPPPQQSARTREPAVEKPVPSDATSPSETVAVPPSTTDATLDTATSTVRPTTTAIPPASETQAAGTERTVTTSTAESAARRRAIARFLLDSRTRLFHEPTCPAAKGLSTKASPSVARMQGYRPHDCVRSESSEE